MSRVAPSRCCTVLLLSSVLVGACDADHVHLAPPAPPVTTEPESEPEPPPVELPATTTEESVAAGAAPRTQVLASGALDLLERHCASCHSNDASTLGLGAVLNVPGLIARGMLVPGASEGSPLFGRLLDLGTHPAISLTPGEIALIGRFIDELERPEPAGQVRCEAAADLSNDATYAALRADLLQQPAEARPFLRYLSIAYASNAGLCGAALQRQRLALFKLVNSVSTAPEIHVPAAVADTDLLYRIDLRNYGWNRDIDLDDDGSVDFADGWLAIGAGVGPYATEWSGPDAAAVQLDTGVSVPVLPGNAFVHAAAQGQLYHALIGARAANYDTETALGIDIIVDANEGRVQRAAFTNPRDRPYRDTMLLRFEQRAVPDRYYWFTEHSDYSGASSIFDDPFDWFGGERQTIFHLPNGLFAYSLDDGNGQRVDTGTLRCDAAACREPPPVNAATCHGCHSDGLLPVRDQIRSVYLDYSYQFSVDTGEEILAQYPPEEDFNALLEYDSELHRAAAERAGVPRHTPDPISRVFLQFERDPLTLRRAAAELAVAPDVLTARLGELDARLGPLANVDGSVDRATFSSVLGSARCVLHADAAQHPTRCP